MSNEFDKRFCYPEWICYDCGEKYGRQSIRFHAKGRNGEYKICGRSETVKESYNYGWLKNGWQQMALQSMAVEVVRSSSIGDQYFIKCLRGEDAATERLRLAIGDCFVGRITKKCFLVMQNGSDDRG